MLQVISGEVFENDTLVHDQYRKALRELYQRVRFDPKYDDEKQQLRNHLIGYKHVIIENAVVEDRLLEGMDIYQSLVRNTKFINCNLRNTLFYGSIFQNCTFYSCELSKVEMSGLSLAGCDFSHSIFDSTDLMRSDCRFANFTGCQFYNMALANIDFRYANLTDCEFDNCGLSESKIYNISTQYIKSLAGLRISGDISVDKFGTEMISVDFESIKEFWVEKT